LRFSWCRGRYTFERKRKKHCRHARGIGSQIRDIALGRDGRSLLVLSLGGLLGPGIQASGIASFGLSRAGRLSYQGCVENSSGDFGPRCRRFRRVPIVNPAGLTVSPNGRWAYVLTSQLDYGESEGSVVILRLKPRPGRLAFSQCIEDARQPGGRCTSPAPFGIVRPRAGWQAAPSFNGGSLYVPSGDGIAGPPELLEFRAR
jgi:hypothetical protein